ncbi:MAG: iron-containing redox enzyme family protein [Actinomycetes bacterium]
MPEPRGPLTSWLLHRLREAPHALPVAPLPEDDPLTGEDTHLALYLCYELHYGGLAGVDEAWEWEPSLLAVRRRLEDAFERAVRREVRDAVAGVRVPATPAEAESQVVAALDALAVDDEEGGLSGWMREHATLEQFREFCAHRSAYQLKEADPHTWAIPRLHGRPKAALVHVQADEYGDGVEQDAHAELFALTMRELDLDDAAGAYLDLLPASTLAPVNLVSMFGLHRRLRAALVGHLAIFEMFSVAPMGRYSETLSRLGASSWARLFFDTHVVADADHQTIAARELAGGLVEQDPAHLPEVLFGAHAICAVEARFSEHLRRSWEAGRTSLRAPLP